MEKRKALNIFDLDSHTDLAEIKNRYRELKEEYQTMIRNAPSGELKQSFQKQLEELEAAYECLITSEDISTATAAKIIIEESRKKPNPPLSEEEAKQRIKDAHFLLDEGIKKFKELHYEDALRTFVDAANLDPDNEEIEIWIEESSKLLDNLDEANRDDEREKQHDNKHTAGSIKKKMSIAALFIVILAGPLGYFLLQNDEAPQTEEEKKALTLKEKYGYTDIYDFIDGYALAKKDSLFGYIDQNGSIVVPFVKADTLGRFQYERAIIKRDEQFGFINKEAEVAVPIIYEYATDFVEGLSIVSKQSKWGFIDTTGAEAIPIQYDEVTSFSEGLALVSKNGKYGYINMEGKEVIPPRYEQAGVFSSGITWVGTDGEYYFINMRGRKITNKTYDYVENVTEERAVVMKNGKIGYINPKGKEIIPLIYDDGWYFSMGRALVKKGEKYGYLDKEGNVVIPFEYDYANIFQDSTTMVIKDSATFYIDLNGSCVLDCP